MQMTKATRARYTLEFKQEAVRLVESGQSIAAASRTLGLVEQTLFNWVKAHREGRLKGADSRSKVTAEQMEISRLRAELARVTLERENHPCLETEERNSYDRPAAPEGAFSEAVNRRLDITVDQYYLENYQQRIHHLL